MGSDWDGYVALELRVEHNGEIYLTESHKERVRFQARVNELRDLLLDTGWSLASADDGHLQTR